MSAEDTLPNAKVAGRSSEALSPDVVEGLRANGLDDVPVIVGGIIPEPDAVTLREQGVARVFTPKDFEITDVLSRIVDAIEDARV